jgi:hypothetical protein
MLATQCLSQQIQTSLSEYCNRHTTGIKTHSHYTSINKGFDRFG